MTKNIKKNIKMSEDASLYATRYLLKMRKEDEYERRDRKKEEEQERITSEDLFLF